MTHHLSFRQLFLLLTLSFCALLAASALSAWTGPTAPAPGGNVKAPVNVGTTDQVKDAGLSLNSLLVVGNAVLYNTGVRNLKLGVNVASPVVSIETSGTIKIGYGGEVCQAVTEGALRYNKTDKVMEFCNGNKWCAIHSGCTPPAPPAPPAPSVGSGLSISNTGIPALAALNSTDVAFIDNDIDSLRLYRWSGSSWSQVGSDRSISNTGAPALAALNSTDIAFIDNSNDSLRVYRK